MDRASRIQLARQAAARAERVRIRCGVEIAAPVDPIKIAEDCGCEVRLVPLTSLEGMYSPTPRPTIVLGSQRPSGRRTFNCIHELGHHEFKHGVRLDQLVDHAGSVHPDEHLVDMFAGFLLMSQTAVRRAVKDRDVRLSSLTPLDVFRLASFFGVGYSTMINHLTWSLQVIDSKQANRLLRTLPKDLKGIFGGQPDSEVVLADTHWRGRAADLEIGDTLVLPNSVAVDDESKVQRIGVIDDQLLYKAVGRGYARAYSTVGAEWAINVRVAPKHFCLFVRIHGLSQVPADVQVHEIGLFRAHRTCGSHRLFW